MVNKSIKKIIAVCMFFVSVAVSIIPISAYAMPFYDLKPEPIVLRSAFTTIYNTSSQERKHNIMLASKSLDNVFVDVGGEFSFNETVGKRTEARGYKKAKIIAYGKFVDGVGGGVCQVSTTLYNAVLLAGLKVTEFHPHSLKVKYVEPSFDAMVNSSWADLKFVNNTHNPVIIKTSADGYSLRVEIYGQKLKEKIKRKSIITGEIEAPKEEKVIDRENKYPEIKKGEEKIIRWSTKGSISEGYIEIERGKVKIIKKIRQDKYSGIKGIIIKGQGEKITEKSEKIEENNSQGKERE